MCSTVFHKTIKHVTDSSTKERSTIHTDQQGRTKKKARQHGDIAGAYLLSLDADCEEEHDESVDVNRDRQHQDAQRLRVVFVRVVAGSKQESRQRAWVVSVPSGFHTHVQPSGSTPKSILSPTRAHANPSPRYPRATDNQGVTWISMQQA